MTRKHRTITPTHQVKMREGKWKKELERMYAYDAWEAECEEKEAREEAERRAFENERMEQRGYDYE